MTILGNRKNVTLNELLDSEIRDMFLDGADLNQHLDDKDFIKLTNKLIGYDGFDNIEALLTKAIRESGTDILVEGMDRDQVERIYNGAKENLEKRISEYAKNIAEGKSRIQAGRGSTDFIRNLKTRLAKYLEDMKEDKEKLDQLNRWKASALSKVQSSRQHAMAESLDDLLYEAALTTDERKDLPDKVFGLPEKRKYPIQDEKHISAAITYFHHCPKPHMQELASNINKQAKKLGMKIHVSHDNPFYKYADRDILEEGVRMGIFSKEERARLLSLAETSGSEMKVLRDADVRKQLKDDGKDKDMKKNEKEMKDLEKQNKPDNKEPDSSVGESLDEILSEAMSEESKENLNTAIRTAATAVAAGTLIFKITEFLTNLRNKSREGNLDYKTKNQLELDISKYETLLKQAREKKKELVAKESQKKLPRTESIDDILEETFSYTLEGKNQQSGGGNRNYNGGNSGGGYTPKSASYFAEFITLATSAVAAGTLILKASKMIKELTRLKDKETIEEQRDKIASDIRKHKKIIARLEEKRDRMKEEKEKKYGKKEEPKEEIKEETKTESKPEPKEDKPSKDSKEDPKPHTESLDDILFEDVGDVQVSGEEGVHNIKDIAVKATTATLAVAAIALVTRGIQKLREKGAEERDIRARKRIEEKIAEHQEILEYLKQKQERLNKAGNKSNDNSKNNNNRNNDSRNNNRNDRSRSYNDRDRDNRGDYNQNKRRY